MTEPLPIGWEQNMADVLTDVVAERLRQQAKWGEQNWPNGTGPDKMPLHYLTLDWADQHLTAAGLAAGATDITDEFTKDGSVTYRDILTEEVFEAYAEDDPARLRAELVQVAAVAVAWIEKIDREQGSHDPI